jgi:beta-glucosidase
MQCCKSYALVTLMASLALAADKQAPKRPWMNTSLSPDERADLVVKQLTLDEKILLVHGGGWGILNGPAQPGSNWGSGFVAGIPRLGIPPVDLDDSAVGVRLSAYLSRYSTPLPSTLALAASWNPRAAFLFGTVIGRELRAQGFNLSVGGGVNLTREPRNGRNFEYAGEDPILAGTMVGQLMKGVQSERIMGCLKHYALNDQETGRFVGNVLMDARAMRESDLLAFEIALRISDAATVMCSYNKINGDWGCENDYTLNHVLKKDFGFKGWVMSDWSATHSTVKAALAGLDQEQPGDRYFGDALKKAVQEGEVPMARLNDMVHRMLRSMFAVGVIDHPSAPRQVVDPFRGLEDAQQVAEQSIVLLKNEDGQLPLDANVASIAVIGGHADAGVLSGGGSSQVDPPGGNPVPSAPRTGEWLQPVYFRPAPLKFIRARAPRSRVAYDPGRDPAAAARLARESDVAIVFVTQHMGESRDAASLALPDNQDALVSAVAAANPHTIVVVESGGPVRMPWIGRVAAVLEAWYPGIGGGEAIASILFGQVNPSAKLPITFPRSEADLPNPRLPGSGLPVQGLLRQPRPFDIPYPEGARAGYKWFDSEHKQPLFPFGHGLSYTTWVYSDLNVDAKAKRVSFRVQNTGTRAGAEIAQVYVTLPEASGERFNRLAAWERVEVAPGESRTITLALDPLHLSIFNTGKDGWELLPGDYEVLAGPSSRETPLRARMHLGD